MLAIAWSAARQLFSQRTVLEKQTQTDFLTKPPNSENCVIEFDSARGASLVFHPLDASGSIECNDGKETLWWSVATP